MKVKYIPRKGAKGIWCYAEKGSKKTHFQNSISKFKTYPTLIFLHGFGSDKDTWPAIIQYIPKKFHSIIIDLPGHGETTFLEGTDSCDISSYVECLKEFLQVTGLDKEKVHLVGCSFGGGIAGRFAFTYPEYLSKLTVFCPAVKTPILSKNLENLLDCNFDILLPKTGKQMVKMIQSLANSPQFWCPQRIMQSFVNLNFSPERRALLQKLLEIIVVDEFNKFDKEIYKIQGIQTDTLIIWGEDDKMLDVSGAYFLHKNVKNSKLRILKNCNHIIQLDQPRMASKYLIEFITN